MRSVPPLERSPRATPDDLIDENEAKFNREKWLELGPGAAGLLRSLKK
jgi:hypothetical protein